MKTISINFYSFDELSEEAKRNVLRKFSNINLDFDWWKIIYEDAENIGLKITGFDLDRQRHATGEFILSAAEVAQNILNTHGEECTTYKTAQIFLEEFTPKFSLYMETEEGESELIEIEANFLNSLLEDYSIILQNEYEFLGSAEAIIQTIRANEYEFTETGEHV